MTDGGDSGRSGASGSKAGNQKSELFLRIVSAAVLVPIVIAATWYGGVAFFGLTALCGAILLYEWVGLTGKSEPAALDWIAGLAVLAAIVLCFVGKTGLSLAVIGATAVMLIVLATARGRAYWLAGGVVYAGLCATALMALRADDLGLVAILFLFAVVWMTDIAAYFTGRAIGGPKLWPAVSPNKTWSGAIGGLIFGVAGGGGVLVASGLSISLPIVLIAALLSIAGQAGDFFESAIKRRAGKKDSGNLIPGHGGLMDRIDALIFAAILAAIVGWIHGGPKAPAQGLLVW